METTTPERPKIRILIVEDEALIAEELRLTLDDFGYEVADVHYTFASARAAIANTDADLVMLDINLGSARPDETGLGLAEVLANAARCVPFIFLTAYSDAEIIRQATRLGPAGYLIKPVSPAAVFAAVQTAIEAAARNASPQFPVPGECAVPQDFFFVKVGKRTQKLCWNEVISIETSRNYVRIRAADTGLEYPLRGSVPFVLNGLMPEERRTDFLRVSRSVHVNRRYITAVSEEWVWCGNEKWENTRLAVTEWRGGLDKR